jgi:hypothetical protein
LPFGGTPGQSQFVQTSSMHPRDGDVTTLPADQAQADRAEPSDGHPHLARALNWYLAIDGAWQRTVGKLLSTIGQWLTVSAFESKQSRNNRRVRNRLSRARTRWFLRDVEQKLRDADLGVESPRARKILWQHYIRESSPAGWRINQLKWIAFVIAPSFLLLPVPLSAYLLSASRAISIGELIVSLPVFLAFIGIPFAFATSIADKEYRRYYKTLGVSILAVTIIGCTLGGVAQFPDIMLISIVAVPILLGFFLVIVLAESFANGFWKMFSRRQIDYLPVTHLAIHDLIDVLSIVAPLRRQHTYFHTRRYLLWRMSRVISTMSSRVSSRHIPAKRKSYGHEFIRDRFLQALALAEETSAAVLTSRNRGDYEDAVERLRSAIIKLLDDDWSEFPEPMRVSGYSWIRVVGIRLLTPVFLIGVAAGLQYLPFINLSDSARTTIQVALLVSALLALAPVDGDAKKQVLSIFQGSPKS